MRASLALRSLRAGVFAAVCVGLAAAAHDLSMHAVPAPGTMAAAFAAAGAVGCLAGSREQSLRAITAAMALVQVGLHLLFDAASPAPPASVPMPAMPGMVGMAGTSDMASIPGMDGSPTMPGMHHPMTGQALAAHALAALLAAWWLRRGEAAVWSLLRRAAALAPYLLTWATRARIALSPRPLDLRAAAFGWGFEPRLRSHLLLRHALIRRGPPGSGPLPVPTR